MPHAVDKGPKAQAGAAAQDFLPLGVGEEGLACSHTGLAVGKGRAVADNPGQERREALSRHTGRAPGPGRGKGEEHPLFQQPVQGLLGEGGQAALPVQQGAVQVADVQGFFHSRASQRYRRARRKAQPRAGRFLAIIPCSALVFHRVYQNNFIFSRV